MTQMKDVCTGAKEVLIYSLIMGTPLFIHATHGMLKMPIKEHLHHMIVMGICMAGYSGLRIKRTG
jgi:hypothetical protein